MFERTLSVNILKHFCPTDVYLGPEKIRRIMKTLSNICFKIIGYVTSVWSAWYIFYLERKIKQKIGKNKKSWWHNSLKALEHNLIRISCTKLELSTVRKVCRRTYKWWWHCIFFIFFLFSQKNWKTTVNLTVYDRWLAPRSVFHLLSVRLPYYEKHAIGTHWYKMEVCKTSLLMA